MRRAVANATFPDRPAKVARGEVVGGELRTGGNNDEIFNDQRLAGQPPGRNLGANVGGHVSRPHGRAVTTVEDVQNARRAERVDASIVERWCRRVAPGCRTGRR